MKAIFVNEDLVPFARWIAEGLKKYETRTKNMLLPCVGNRVAIVSTKRGRRPLVIGYADMVNYFFCNSYFYEAYVKEAMIPRGSKYDVFGTRGGRSGKWFYEMANAETCVPYELPADAVRHGRSWCEF